METRIQRYKKYRAELIKEGSDVTVKEKPKMTTTALPIQEVIDMVEDDNKNLAFYRQQHREKILKYVLIVIFLIALIVGIIMFGIYAFRG